MSNFFTGLFPETPPISLTPKHLRLLKELLERKEATSTKELIRTTKIDKTTFSEIKNDLMGLGWCSETSYGNGKEVFLKVSKIKEIYLFISRWQSLQRSLMVRPHHIIFKGLIVGDLLGLKEVISKMSQLQGIRLITSHMRNNSQSIITIEGYGKVIFLESSSLITIYIDDFILPIDVKNVSILEDYIIQLVLSRFDYIIGLVSPVLKGKLLTIHSAFSLSPIHLGIVTKEKVSKILSQCDLMADLGLFQDKSIGGCIETEAKGNLQTVTNKITAMISTYLEKEKTELNTLNY